MLTETQFVIKEVSHDLYAQSDIDQRRRRAVHETYAESEVFPWLERARWTSYLDGFVLHEVSSLADAAIEASEPFVPRNLSLLYRSTD